jgi:hypothetical protein
MNPIYLNPHDLTDVRPTGVLVPLVHVRVRSLEGRDLLEWTRQWRSLSHSFFGTNVSLHPHGDGSTSLALNVELPPALRARADALRAELAKTPPSLGAVDEAMARNGIPGRSNSESRYSAGELPVARIISSDEYRALESLAALKKEARGLYSALTNRLEDAVKIIESNPRMARVLHRYALAESPDALTTDEGRGLIEHLLRRSGVPMPLHMTPSLLDSLIRTPHRVLQYVSDHMNEPVEQVKQLLHSGHLRLGMTGFDVHKNGDVWERVEPTAESNYLPVALRGNVFVSPDLPDAIPAGSIVSGRSVVRVAKMGQPVPSVGSPVPQASEDDIVRALLKQPRARVILMSLGFAMNAKSGVSLWTAPDGRTIQVPFHSRSARRATEALGLRPDPYDGPEDAETQLLLNHGFARTQLSPATAAIDVAGQPSEKQAMALEKLMPAGEDRGLREVYGRIVGPNGEALAYPRSLPELVGREPAHADETVDDLVRPQLRARQQTEFNAALQRHLSQM